MAGGRINPTHLTDEICQVPLTEKTDRGRGSGEMKRDAEFEQKTQQPGSENTVRGGVKQEDQELSVRAADSGVSEMTVNQKAYAWKRVLLPKTELYLGRCKQNGSYLSLD